MAAMLPLGHPLKTQKRLWISWNLLLSVRMSQSGVWLMSRLLGANQLLTALEYSSMHHKKTGS
jgi:hypothetical protein